MKTDTNTLAAQLHYVAHDIRSETVREAADRLEQLERELAAAKERAEIEFNKRLIVNIDRNFTKAELAAERALADRLAEILEDIRHFYGIAECAKQPVTEALAAWKGARDEP